MKSGFQPTGPGRERTVLAAGLVTAAGLLVAAFKTTGDADLAGEVAKARIASDVAETVVAEWGRLLRDRTDPAPAVSTRFRWSAGSGAQARRAPVDRRPSADEGPDVFRTLLAEAERLERSGGSATACLELTLQAIESETDPPRRAEARLRAIQYASRSGDAEAAREQWQAAQEELGPSDARGDTAYLLLCGLAAAPLFEPEERARVRTRLLEFWNRGELALPADDDRFAATPDGRVELRPAPNITALRERLANLDPEVPFGTLLAADADRRLVRGLGRALGGAPRPDPTGSWKIDFAQPFVFASRTVATRDVEGFFVARAAIEAALRARSNVPAGFAIDFDGDAAGLGATVTERTALEGDAFAFVLRHENPETLAHAERQRVRLFSGALGLFAVLAAAASFFTFRALRRERALGELKSEFIAGVSHDLRTPLSSILLLAENLEDGRIKEESARRRYYGTIRREADRLRRLVDDVLDFSRIERGERKELRREEVALQPFFDELAEELGDRAKAAGFKLSSTRSGLPESGSLDTEAVRRAAWNLVDNALKHSGGETVAFDVEAHPGGLCGITVADDGRGIPAEERDGVFRPFARLEHNGANAGTGLGLAIVREVARAHGGSATVSDGAGGRGSTFRLTLDLRSDVDEREER